MIILTDDEVEDWCTVRGIAMDREQRLLSYASHPMGVRERPYVALPEVRGQVMRLADALVAEDELNIYYGSMLWIREWVIFQSVDERTAIKLVTQFASGYGHRASLESGTGYLFNPTERIDQAALLAAVILCQWDAYLIPAHGQHAVFLSHDGIAEITGASPDAVTECLEQFPVGWKMHQG